MLLRIVCTARGRFVCLEKTGEFIPAGSVKFVKVTCPRVPHGGSDLAPGLLLFPSLVTIDNGLAYVPVVNVGATGAHPKQVLGMLHQVEGVEGEQLDFEEGSDEVAQVTLVSAQAGGVPPVTISDAITALYWPGPSPAEGKRATAEV